MNTPTTFELKEPKTVTLSPQTIAVILDALGERPMKIALPAFQELVGQITQKPEEKVP